VSTVFYEVGGPTHRILLGNRCWHFEMHAMLGPMICNADGDGLSKYPNALMEAITFWVQQGERKDANGYCIWERPAHFG
jgi:hypothetical protein